MKKIKKFNKIIKNEKGITGIDVIISLIIIVLFVSLIISLFYNLYLTTVNVRRNERAIEYAVKIFEKIEEMEYEEIILDNVGNNDDEFITKLNELLDDSSRVIIYREGTDGGYNQSYKIKISVEKYDNEQKTYKDLIRKINIEISYKVGGNLQTVSLHRYKTKYAVYTDILGIKPQLENGMIPVKYIYTNKATGEGAWYKTTIYDNEWFDYSAKKWANVMIGNIDEIEYDPETGKIEDENIKDMFVYIPRYAYQIKSGYHNEDLEENEAGEIDIKFLNLDNSCKDGSGADVKTQISESQNANENYILHPAFKFGATDLKGIWVAKFEASADNDAVRSLPGKTSWTGIEIATMYTKSREFVGEFNFDSHMMKNIEWGAVAYLTHSKYGRNGTEIDVNKTGEGDYNGYFYSGGGQDTQYKINTNQSTTGNIYGIYDLSGGAGEYVMGVIEGGVNITISDTKYYDSYINTNGTRNDNFEANRLKYGDAVYETSKYKTMMSGGYENSEISVDNWFSDLARYPCQEGQWFIRGCPYLSDNPTWPGIFTYYSDNGNPDNTYGFRITITSIDE